MYRKGKLKFVLNVCMISAPCVFVLYVFNLIIVMKKCLCALCCVCQVKKAPRWSCKLCGEKQSLLKVRK